MKVLLAASEVAPLIKIGGLGDVVGSLPKALELLDVNVDVIVPFYPTVEASKYKLYKSIELNVPFDNKNNVVEVFNTKLPESNVDVILLKNSEYFSFGGKNAYRNKISETEMFSFFDKAVVEFIKSRFNTYDLIHCNDWHTGLITHLLEDELSETRPATLFTIHNLLYQGEGNLNIIREIGLVPGEHELIEWDLEDNSINLMLQGITSADFVSTVSPSYAKEILSPEFGQNLYEILLARKDRLTGILNGIDYSVFPRNFDIGDWEEQKGRNKTELRKKLNLANVAFPTDSLNSPLFCFVSRLDPGQKGLDLLFQSVSYITENGGQFVLLGTGDKSWETKFKNLLNESEYNDKVSINIMFNNDLAVDIYKSSDFIIIPSKYEPCGLNQMIAMWYGTLPIARGVGGLKDSVDDGVDGFIFNEYSQKELINALKKAFEVYKQPHSYKAMVGNALKKDFSWKKSAVSYKDLYEKVFNLREEALRLM